jgi:hypothetical protein
MMALSKYNPKVASRRAMQNVGRTISKMGSMKGVNTYRRVS